MGYIHHNATVHHPFDRRTTAGIRSHIVKRGKQDAFFRPLHWKEDGEAIAAWRLEPDKIRRVITVRSFAWVQQPLTFWFQTELQHPCRDTRPPVRCFKYPRIYFWDRSRRHVTRHSSLRSRVASFVTEPLSLAFIATHLKVGGILVTKIEL